MPDIISTPFRLGVYLQFEPEATVDYLWTDVGHTPLMDDPVKLPVDLPVCTCTIRRDAYGLPAAVGYKAAVFKDGKPMTKIPDVVIQEKLKTGALSRALKHIGIPADRVELKVWIDVALRLAGVPPTPHADPTAASVQSAPPPTAASSPPRSVGVASTSNEWNGRENVKTLLEGIEGADRAIIQKRAKELGFEGNMMQPAEDQFSKLVQAVGEWRDGARAEEEEPF